MAKVEDEEIGGGPLALGALQSQIAELRERIAHLEELLAKSSTSEIATRLSGVERAFGLLAAILGELHSNAARSDISGLVAGLKKLVPPPVAETEEVKRAA